MVNPRGAILLNHQQFNVLTLYGLILTLLATQMPPGKLMRLDQLKVELEGCFTDLKGNLIFIFSGPSTASTIIELERKVLTFLFKNIQRNPHIRGFVTLCTDSKLPEDAYFKSKAGFSDNLEWEECEDSDNLISCNNFKVQFLFRN